MPPAGVTDIVFIWRVTFPAWYASRPSSMRVTYLAPFATSPVAFQVQVFLNVGIWYEPGPTETLRAVLTWASVRSEQASSGGAAFAAGAAAAPTMKVATTSKARPVAERMS
jgi:hypothetical protein